MPIIASFIFPHPPIILPEVGRGREKVTQATIDACYVAAEKIRALEPDTIFVVSPHSLCYADYFHVYSGNKGSGDFSRFDAPKVQISVNYDEDFVEELEKVAKSSNIPAGRTSNRKTEDLDHGFMVPLYFLLKNQLPNCKFVRSGFSGLSSVMQYQYGQCIAKAAENIKKKVVFVASGDLSHRLLESQPDGFAPEGPVFDEQITAAMATGEFNTFLTFDQELVAEAAECGLRSFQIMAGALDGKAVSPSLLSYEGPFGVGYAVATFNVTGIDESRCLLLERLKKPKAKEDEFVALARLTLETLLKENRLVDLPESLPEEMITKKAGVFVSMHISDELRGCVGTLAPVSPSIADEIRRNTVSAALHDNRFPSITKAELPFLKYKVDVLGHPEPLQSLENHDVQKYGIIVSSGQKRGVLLPALPNVRSAKEQLQVALMKGGISQESTYKMERFQVTRHTGH